MRSPLGYCKNFKGAFTLAEVLITLGIIGVVAAITVPVISANIQNRILRSQFQKQYSNIYSAINSIEYENGAQYECGLSTGVAECKSFWDAFFKKFNIINSCRYSAEDCTPNYKTKDEVIASGGSSTTGNCSYLAYGKNNFTVNKLSDGAYIIFSTESYSIHQAFFTIDINGEKGPNKWGYDVFYMAIDKRNNKLRLTDWGCALWEKGGRRIQNMLIDNDDVKSDWETF